MNDEASDRLADVKSISLVFDEKDRDFAEFLANKFLAERFEVYTAPTRLPNCKSYQNVTYYRQISNSLNIALLSANLFRNHRNIFEEFSRAAANKQQNIQIISMDQDWQQIASPLIEPLRKVIFFENFSSQDNDRNATVLADHLLHRVRAGDQMVSHMTKAHVLQFLSASYSQTEIRFDANELRGQIEFLVVDCKQLAHGQYDRYLVLFPKASLEKTRDYLRELEPALLDFPKPRLYTIRSKPHGDLTVRQRELTAEAFGCLSENVIRFETRVAEQSLNFAEPRYLTDPAEFSVPQTWHPLHGATAPIQGKDLAFKLCVESALGGAAQRLVFLCGPGGAGKTHFSRFLNDQLLKTGHEVFFLSSDSVAQTWSTRSMDDVQIRSLYDVYRCCWLADTDSEVRKPLASKEVFDLKFFVNDPTVILDGLEEIITILGERFSVSEFFKDCISKSERQANGRIIVTTRETQYLGEAAKISDQFEVQLFGQKQAKQYFDRSLPENSEAQQLALTILRRMVGDKVRHEISVPPLFCVIIANELAQTDDFSDIKQAIGAGDFDTYQGFESFLGIILRREWKLGYEWPVSETLRALGIFAVKSVGGPISRTVATDILASNFPLEYEAQIESAIRHSIFLTYDAKSESLSFRYDFLRTVFLSDYIIRLFSELNLDSILGEDAKLVFLKHLIPGSDVVKRIVGGGSSAANKEFLDGLEAVLSDWIQSGSLNLSDRNDRVILSNLTFIYVVLKGGALDAKSARDALDQVYNGSARSRNFSNLSMFLFDQEPSIPLKFDLRGATIRNGWFSSFSVDRSLLVDELTEFIDCRFEKCLSDRPAKNASIWTAKYPNCNLPSEFSSRLGRHVRRLERDQMVSEEELRKFLRLFSKGLNFSAIRQKSTLESIFSGSHGATVTDYLNALIRAGVLTSVTRAEISYQISEDRRQEVRRFVMDRISSKALSLALSQV